MTALIADNLTLVFTAGVSLRTWRDTGLLSREWALYRELLPHYGSITLLTYGGADDPAILAGLLSPDEAAKVRVICNDQHLAPGAYSRSIASRVAASLKASRSVVVKTNQMAGGDTAISIANALREVNHTVGFIARGGYLWTRFVAYEHGPQSAEALSAAAKERFLCQAADAVVGTTSDMVEDLAWRYGLDPQRCVVVPNYVLIDTPVRSPEEREPATLLYAGQLSNRKRVDILIRAAAALRDEARVQARLEVIGDGPERAALESLAAQLSAPVTFRSRVAHEELLERMGRCTIYLQASELEGHPKTVLEAMGSGATVLVAKSPGLGEVVTHGMNGLRVDTDPAAFSAAINELLPDPEWRAVLGHAAARTIRQQFGLPSVMDLELEVHRRALAHGSRRGALKASA
ncbi:D-inositol 3-phosphate glycosyltransferase [Phycisphaerales bacterium]|nr:D-inositol 3-phosphate glycosyltransferase [Phycisphaerales bacterium]